MIGRILWFLLFFLVSLPQAFSNSNPRPERGVLDLRTIPVSEMKVRGLQGEWLFYWHRLLPPDSLSTPPIPPGGSYVWVPSYWTSYSDSLGNKLSPQGYATYFLRILLPHEPGDSLGFSLPVFDSSFEFFVNGKKAGSNGKVGTSPQTSRPGYSPFTVYFPKTADTLDIVIHAANYDHRRGGFWKQMLFGNADSVRKHYSTDRLILGIMLGVLAAYFLFFLFFYLIFPRSKILIFFTLALAGITFRLAATSIFPVQLFFNISWLWLIRIEYLGTYMALCFGLWYFETLFPAPVTRKINIINSAMSGLIAVVILSSRVRIFSWSVYYLEPVALLMTGWYMLASFKRRKERDRWNYLYFIAFLVYLLALLNDIFLANSWEAFSMRYILHFSVLLLIIVQALMIIRNWVRIFIEKERLLGKIEYININLENIVKARTEEVNVRNVEIRHQNKKIARQNDELQREIEFKNRVFSIIAHDLREPLSSINLYLQMATTDLPVAKRKDVLESTVAIARSTYNLVENLLYWGRSQDKQLSLNAREFKLEDVIREIFSLLHETARPKGRGSYR